MPTTDSQVTTLDSLAPTIDSPVPTTDSPVPTTDSPVPSAGVPEQQQKRTRDADDPARIQPWFATMSASLLPALVSFYLPDAFRLPLFVATGVLYFVGCVMLYQQTKEKPRGSDR